ncbi:MAG: hypothetical protein V4505_13885 [Pseudomonadota bacterium]
MSAMFVLVARRLCRSALCTAVAFGAAACGQEDFPSRAALSYDGNTAGLATRDMAPVALNLQSYAGERVEPFLGETTLVVPKAYLDSVHWGGRLPLMGAGIQVVLPDMVPVPVYGEALFARMKETDRRLLEDDPDAFRRAFFYTLLREELMMTVSYGHCFGISKGKLEWMNQFGTKEPDDPASLFDKFDIGGPNDRASMYVPKRPLKYPTYIRCNESGNPQWTCTGYTDYDALVAYEYQFSIVYLTQYQMIEEKIRKLISSFITKNQPSPAMPAACQADVLRK